jgi:hypothetical protein
VTARSLCRRGPALAAAVLGTVALAACGSSGGAHSSTAPRAPSGASATVHAGPLSISPAAARPTSTVRFAFTAPVASGVSHGMRIAYSLSVTGPARGGCIGVHEASSAAVGAHARATITVGPSQLGKDWCTGRYTARVLELARAACKASAPCPQYIRVVATVARGGFRVTAG